MQVRKTIDCRQFPNNPQGCSVTITGREDEVLKAAVRHGRTVHGYPDKPETRAELASAMRPEGPLSAQPGRKVADCRSIPSEINCSLTFSGPEEEVVKVVTEHAVEDHHEPYSPELVKMIRDGLVDETRFQESAPAPGP